MKSLIKEIKLQNIILKNDSEFDTHWWMLYRGSNKFKFDDREKCFHLGGDFVEFFTYLNSITTYKWKKYTNIQELGLKMTVAGNFKIELFGHYRDDNEIIQKKILKSETYNLESPTEIIIDYPQEEDCTMYSFQISSYTYFDFYSGHYYGKVDEQYLRNIDICVNITTFKRESYIQRNIRLLNNEFFNTSEDAAKHYHINVVDNGRTLDVENLSNSNISIIPNINVGGSGGFARGMIESIKSPTKYTHIILMDDDVKILPESFIRTYSLLSIIKDEYLDYFISGSMLMMDAMNIQHEDVGYVHKDGSYRPKKPIYELHLWDSVFKNEEPLRDRVHEYAAWWYCCVPMKFVREDNLPLPIFVRGDDVEFSLRNNAKILTLGGICVWHMSFAKKYNQSLELYQVLRNSLVIQSTSSIFKEIDLIPRFNSLFNGELCRLDYNGAELVLDALAEYMNGPEFFLKPNGEQCLKEHNAKNEVLVNVEDLYIDPDYAHLYDYIPLSKIEKKIYRFTYNGHKLPKFMLSEEDAIVPHDWFNCEGRQFLAKRIISVNPHTKKAIIRYRDNKKFHELVKRHKKLLKYYIRNKDKIAVEYSTKQKLMTSMQFWERYLGLN